MAPPTVLIAGLGSIGRRHVRILRELLPEVRIVALRHRSSPTTHLPEGVDACVTSVDEALEWRPWIGVVANPSPMHLEVAIPLARAGVHLMVEKPIADKSTAVEALIEECLHRGSILAVGYNLRFLPTLRAFKACLDEGRIGSVLSVRAEVGQALPTWRPGADYRSTVSAQAALGGGVMLELSHELDYLRWLFGEFRWVSAAYGRQSALDVDVEDTALLLLGTDRPTPSGTLMISLSMDFVRQDTTRTCTVIGELGTLRWDGINGRVDIYLAEAGTWEEVAAERPERDYTYRAEWESFLECVEKGIPPVVSGLDGLAVVKVIEAARQSWDSRRHVDLVGGGA